MQHRVHDRRTLACSVAAVLVGLFAASSASAATEIGQTYVVAIGDCSSSFTELQTASVNSSYAAPSAGVITSWRVQAPPTPPQIKFKVARSAGGNSFTIVGQSPDSFVTLTPSALNSFPARVPVQAGDVIGFAQTASGGQNCLFESGHPGFQTHQLNPGDPAPGTTATFGGPILGDLLDLAATLEPDADNDGFGDETQDGCPINAATQGPCPDTAAPETTFSDRPDDKTKKKTATFEFVSSEPSSTFECKLDDGEFQSCTSPHDVKVGKGNHIFEVRARDSAGNVDSTPATDSWKVKKKKKKKK